MIQKKLAAAIIKYRFAIAAVVISVTVAAVYYAIQIRFDSSIEIWFVDDDPQLLAYHEFLSHFEADEISVIGVFSDDILNPLMLQHISHLSKKIAKAPFVHQVRSITNIDHFENRSGDLYFGKLIEQYPQTPGQKRALAHKIKKDPLIYGTLMAKDFMATSIIVDVDAQGRSFEGKQKFVTAIRKILKDNASSHVKYAIAGSPPMDDAVFRYSVDDFLLLAPLVMLMVILTIVIVFRRIEAVIASVFVVSFSSVWTFAFMGVVNIDINILSAGLISVILAVSIAVSVHILSEYYHQLQCGLDVKSALQRSIALLMVPCFFTSITTVIGFLSLQVSELKVISQFGLLASFGVAASFVMSMLVTPTIVSFFPKPKSSYIHQFQTDIFASLVEWLANPGLVRRIVVLMVGIPIVLIGFWWVTKLPVGSNPLEYFRPLDPIRIEHMAIDKTFGGSLSVEFLLETEDTDLKDPLLVKQIDRFSNWMRTQPGVARVHSYVDIIKEVYRNVRGLDKPDGKIPCTRSEIAQLLLLFEGSDDFYDLIKQDYTIGRLTVVASSTEAGLLSSQHDVIAAKMKEIFVDPRMQVTGTGFVKLMSDMERYLLHSQRDSFLMAGFLVTLMLMLLLRSFWLGLFSMIPNVAPIIMGLTCMYVFDIMINPGTVMIGAITLGLVVDDTVHFLVRIQRRLQKGCSLEQAIPQAMHDTARPIIVTSIILAIGFSILGLASFTPNVHFGLITAVVIMFALLADLILLPVLLVTVKPKLG